MGNTGTSIAREAETLEWRWAREARWAGVTRPYAAEDVIRLRGSAVPEHTLARRGAERLWELLHTEDVVAALGCMTGGQAVECVKAGLRAIYLSGWQVAADANLAGETYPDQSLYPANSVPAVVRRINNALRRADQIAWSSGTLDRDWLAPIVADAEAGFGGTLHAFELMGSMIEAGAAGVHFEDQLASEKKCGHLGGQGARPDRAVRADPHRRPARRRRRRRADRADRPDRRALGDAAHVRRRRARPPLPHGRAHGRGVLPRPRRHGSGGRAGPRVRAVRRPGVVRDGTARSRGGPGVRRGDPRPSTRTGSSRTTAAPRSTGGSISTTRRSLGSARSWPRWATGSSSSRSRGSTR